MKINILSSGRFHVLDLARELDDLGYDVRFYSYVPTKRAMKFGLRKECSYSLFFIMLPFLCIARLFPFLNRYVIVMQDSLSAWLMRPCDVLIAMSGNYIYSLKYAKAKFNAKIIIERGSKHILEQKRILEDIPSLKGTRAVPDTHVKREMESYDLCDYITIPSEHVRKSFVERDCSENKLFVNPYGVMFSDFYPMSKESNYDVIMVGSWCYRKGCDLLIQACEELKLKLLHVGAIADMNFPSSDCLVHVDPVDQFELVKYYAQSKIFVLPSREEGLALVQSQALACGLPIVCSQHTGGRDIANITGLNQWVFEMEVYSVEALKTEIVKALNFCEIKNVAELELSNLSWKAYGMRYKSFLDKV